MLYIVATPIGNLGDMTFRAVETLRAADLVACEDTRVTKRLLSHYEVGTPTISYFQHSKLSKVDKIIEELGSGKNIALVTDAGTPGISDPGEKLVEEVIKNGIKVVPIPGASALGAMISVAGIDMQKFLFLAFPPHKKGRETFFRKIEEMTESELPVIFYESPHRIIKSLKSLKSLKDLNVIVGREMTKMFEEIVRGTAGEVLEYFERHPEKVKGEFAIIAFK
ncbi:MAG TPA: 16S rRNA (cytidine(1402)-2'-O)-methyltransferase [Candidatus Moranbacteria bacterium]|nr:16S rRNA (cytidine(1402)-2'-O)-methyltransferase [Candidatus Moranbacteria bacterium]